MTCAECRDLFSDLYDEALPGDRLRAAEDHVHSCPSCGDEFHQYRRALQALHLAGSVTVPERFTQSVRLAITSPPPPAVGPAPAPEPAPAIEAAPEAEKETRRLAPTEVTSPTLPMPAAPPPTRTAPPTRRTTATQRFLKVEAAPKPWKLWTSTAAAAGLLFGLLVGSLIPREESDGAETLRAKVEDLERKNRELAARRPPDNVVLKDGRQIPIEIFVEEEFTRADLVREGTTWMPREIRDRLNRGEALVDGRWSDVRAEIRRQVEAEIAALPKAPSPEAVEHQVIERLGLVRFKDRYLPRDWLAALDSGQVLTAEGEWKKFDDVVARLMAEHRLVRHDGRWMSEEERAALVAQPRVRRPEGAALDGAVAALLDDLEVAPPLGFRNLTLYPLRRPGRAAVVVAGLHEATATGRVELIDDAGALSARVRNGSLVDVMLLGGTVLAGGRHGRIVARDALVPAGQTLVVPVFDAEPGALRRAERFAKESGHYLATPSMRGLLLRDGGQGPVWNSMATMLAAAKRGTGLPDVYKAQADRTAEYRAALLPLRDFHPDLVGVAVAVGGQLEAADVFAAPELFRSYFERILMAAALEAALRANEPRIATHPHSLAAVRQFVESTYACPSETVQGVAYLQDPARPVPRGRALLREGVALHAMLVTESDPPPLAPALEISATKVQSVLDGYEERLKQAPAARKAAVVRQIAALPQLRVSQQLLRHLEDQDENVRRAVIEALGERGDAAAVKPLLKIFRDRRTDPPTFQAAASALATLGHPDAVGPMLDAVEGEDPARARVAAERMSLLLLSLREESVLERAVGRLIDLLEESEQWAVPDDPRAADLQRAQVAAVSGALRQTTGMGFARPAEFRKWWNDPLSRKKFLGERAK